MDLELFSQIMPIRFYRTRAMVGTRYPNRKYSYARCAFSVSSEILFRLSRHIITPVVVGRALCQAAVSLERITLTGRAGFRRQ